MLQQNGKGESGDETRGGEIKNTAKKEKWGREEQYGVRQAKRSLIIRSVSEIFIFKYSGKRFSQNI